MNEALYLSFQQSGAPDEVIKELKKKDKVKQRAYEFCNLEHAENNPREISKLNRI